MRVAVVVLAVFVIGIWARELPQDERQNLRRVQEKCQANSATRTDDNVWTQLSQNVNNPDAGAHLLCVSVGVGLQQQNGQINRDTLKNKISLVTDDRSQVDGIVTKCAVQEDTPERTATNMWRCLAQNRINYIPVV